MYLEVIGTNAHIPSLPRPRHAKLEPPTSLKGRPHTYENVGFETEFGKTR